MKKPYGLVSLGVTVFKVLAWVSLVIQVVVGLIVLVSGGEAVPIGGIDVPARLIGLLNCIAGVLYFFILLLVSTVLRLVLDIREQLGSRSS